MEIIVLASVFVKTQSNTKLSFISIKLIEMFQMDTSQPKY